MLLWCSWWTKVWYKVRLVISGQISAASGAGRTEEEDQRARMSYCQCPCQGSLWRMTPGLELSTNLREVRIEVFLLKAPSRIFTVKTLLRHYAKQMFKHCK